MIEAIACVFALAFIWLQIRVLFWVYQKLNEIMEDENSSASSRLLAFVPWLMFKLMIGSLIVAAGALAAVGIVSVASSFKDWLEK